MTELTIHAMSEPDDDGNRGFIIGYNDELYATTLLADGSVRTVGVEMPREILKLAHEEMALAHEFDGYGIPFEGDGKDDGFPLVVTA